MATALPRNRAPFRLEEAASVCSGTLRGPDGDARGVVTDSRLVTEGSLFVALIGERHDAHRFLSDVAASGAAGAVVARGCEPVRGLPTIVVEDTLVALGDLARHHRERSSARVVGITGSAGKTSTKDLARAALCGAGLAVLATEGNLNNRVGVPLTLFLLDERHDVALVEMGTSEKGEIATLADIVRPEVGLVTQVAAAHTEGLISLDEVAEEKGALFAALGKEGVAIGNLDDPRVALQLGRSQAHRLGYGQALEADVRLVSWHLEAGGTRARYRFRELEREVDAHLSLLGEAAAVNGAAALTLAHALEVPLGGAVRGLEEARPTPGRLFPRRGTRGIRILDDTYNANPRSTIMALHTARALADAHGGGLVAVLGDMKELGALSEEGHREVGKAVAASGCRALLACGEAMKGAAVAARRCGVEVIEAADAEEATERVPSLLRDGDVLLVKGSRSMAMERVVEALAHAEEILS